MLYRSECNSVLRAGGLGRGALPAWHVTLAAVLLWSWLPVMAPRLWAQEVPAPVSAPSPAEADDKRSEPARDALTLAEKERIRRAGSLSAQMKVFSDVAQQYVGAVREAANAEQEARLQETAATLAAVYRRAEAHMQQSPERKKHKHLKKFEIAVREQVLLLKNLQSLSPYALREFFTAPIEAGERVRKNALNLTLGGGTVKK